MRASSPDCSARRFDGCHPVSGTGAPCLGQLTQGRNGVACRVVGEERQIVQRFAALPCKCLGPPVRFGRGAGFVPAIGASREGDDLGGAGREPCKGEPRRREGARRGSQRGLELVPKRRRLARSVSVAPRPRES